MGRGRLLEVAQGKWRLAGSKSRVSLLLGGAVASAAAGALAACAVVGTRLAAPTVSPLPTPPPGAQVSASAEASGRVGVPSPSPPAAVLPPMDGGLPSLVSLPSVPLAGSGWGSASPLGSGTAGGLEGSLPLTSTVAGIGQGVSGVPTSRAAPPQAPSLGTGSTGSGLAPSPGMPVAPSAPGSPSSGGAQSGVESVTVPLPFGSVSASATQCGGSVAVDLAPAGTSLSGQAFAECPTAPGTSAVSGQASTPGGSGGLSVQLSAGL